MPTPSSNAPPDHHSPRSFPFSSCPDPDEEQALQSQTQLSTVTALAPESPPSWEIHQPHTSARAVAQTSQNMDDDGDSSRSTTMSPGPSSVITRDVDMMGREPEGMGAARPRDDAEDGQKQGETDDDMGRTETGRESAHRQGALETEAERNSFATTSGASAVGEVPVRRKQKSVDPAIGELNEMEIWDLMGYPLPWVEDCGLGGLGYEYSQRRVVPTSPSSFLRPGSQFKGTQQSERQVYQVEVEIKHIDLRESFLCGYLRIQGLTDDHPTLTTYFEGEIIGPKYGFITQHPSWGATDKIDISHWKNFAAFRPFIKQSLKGGQIYIKDPGQRENIFMRWKEHFLVPDHRVRTINGASFEGFYYICFNQVRGEVSGIYFHSKSEKFQRLELQHVRDKGCFGAVEFR